MIFSCRCGATHCNIDDLYISCSNIILYLFLMLAIPYSWQNKILKNWWIVCLGTGLDIQLIMTISLASPGKNSGREEPMLDKIIYNPSFLPKFASIKVQFLHKIVKKKIIFNCPISFSLEHKLYVKTNKWYLNFL